MSKVKDKFTCLRIEQIIQPDGGWAYVITRRNRDGSRGIAIAPSREALIEEIELYHAACVAEAASINAAIAAGREARGGRNGWNDAT